MFSETTNNWAENETTNNWVEFGIKQCMKMQLFITYPTVNFNDLEKQNDNCMTDDGCIHYKTKNNNIYSWNNILNKWQQPNEQGQRDLLKLFVK